MKNNIRIFFLSYLIYCLSLYPVLADTASLLPNAVQQFFDNNGNPLTSGTVTTYQAGTSTLATTWKDSAETLPNTNPIKLDGGGKAIIYGNQTYRQVVKDRNGNLIWDAVTAPGGGGGSSTTVGDGNLVGTILPWSGLIAPNQYVFGYGQEINRTTYATFYTAVTQQLNVICSSASNILTGISDTSQVKIGEKVELALCVPAGTTVTAKTASTITLSNPSSVSINAVGVFFPWGNGDGSTTFNVPDLRGYAPVGRDNMGGTSAGRISTANCGGGITPDALGAICGQDSTTISNSNLPASIPYTDPGHTHALSQSPAVAINAGTGGGGNFLSSPTVITALSNTTGITINPGSPNTAISRIQPSVTLNYIVKIVPDTSTTIATGVFSVGGMTGVIACGTGILCTGNVISFNGSTFAGGTTNNVQYNGGAGVLAGSPNFSFISPDNLVLGAAGVTAKFDISGSTSGRVRQRAPAVAGTTNIAWGTNNGTPAVSATSPLFISGTTGDINISPDALTRINDTNVTLTLSGGSGTAVISPTTMTLGWSGQLSIARGGTGLSSCPTATTVVHGGASTLSCSQIINSDITTNTISNSNLNQATAATLKGNPTAGTANVQDFTIQGLTQTISPTNLDFIPIFDNATGTFKKINANSIAISSTAGVSALNSLTGSLTLNATTGLNIASVGTTITITPDTATLSNLWSATSNKLVDANGLNTAGAPVVITYAASVAPDFTTFIDGQITLTGNLTLANPTTNAAQNGRTGCLYLVQSGGGGTLSAVGTSWKFPGGTVPTLSIGAGSVDVLCYKQRTTTFIWSPGLNKALQ